MALRQAGRALSVARVLSGLLLASAIGTGCVGYQADTAATNSIGSVRVTTSAAEVASCRFLQHVDSRDSALGCGLTVQPTPEECLRYQVRRAGGDTLLIRGPAGEAYDCSRGTAEAAAAPKPSAPATAPSAPAPSPSPAARPTPSPAPAAAAAAPPPEPTPVPAPAPSVRVAADPAAARGCVYLGELRPSTACDVAGDAAAGDCAAQALRLGGDLIVQEQGRGQIFSCKARP